MSELIQYKCTNCHGTHNGAYINPWTCPFCGYEYTTQTLKEQTMSDNVWTDEMRATCKRMQREDFYKKKEWFSKKEDKVMRAVGGAYLRLSGAGRGWVRCAKFNIDDTFYRISPDFVPPAPPKPAPLTAKDVPAGAMYRKRSWAEGSRRLIAVSEFIVTVYWPEGNVTDFTYDALAEEDHHEMLLINGDVRKWRK